MDVLITGSSGFVGQNLTAYMAGRHGIHTLTRSDLTNVNAGLLNNISTVVHLAGKAHDLKNVSSPHDYYNINFELTKKLYDAFLLADAKQFIFISSVKAAADKVEGVLTEDAEPNPETHYGKSKLMAEQYIQNQPLPLGKSYYILRPCMILGPGNKGNLNLLYQFVKKNIPYPLAGFKNKRSFLTVQNLCFVINEIINRHDIPCGIYNVADDEPLSTNQVVTILSKSLNKEAILWNLSPSLIKLIAKAGDILHLPLNSERLEKLTGSFVVSNNKIKMAIEKNLPLTVSEGLLVTAQSFNL